ncbi:MAG TPA: DUF4097 family beta strand repeat-containing protein [Verrucomicrobiae bacterium]|nr:DUF4097 family beta strand repeat-containing protein [Verrucomicrobiae bacterium]
MTNGIQRRGSIFTGLLLILLGVIFLLDRFDPAFKLGHLIRVYWPVLIIVWGVAKLVDHLTAQRSGLPRAALLSGGEAGLMILLAFVLAGFVFRDWIREHYPDFNIELPPFHESYTQSGQLAPQALPAGSHVTVETGRGDISIHAAEDNNLRVSINKSAYAPSQSAADEEMHGIEIAIQQEGNVYHIRPVRSGDPSAQVSVNLDVAMPKAVSLEVATFHGDIQVAGISGAIAARSGSGDIDIHDAGSDVTIEMQRGDAKIASVNGDVKLTGRGSDVDLSKISGSATVAGGFVGTIRASNVAKTLRCVSPWSDLTIAHLTGTLEADSGDISLTDADGSAKLVTHNKDVTVKNVSGRLEIVNTHGDVNVSYAASPRDDLSVTNDTGDTDVTLPGGSSFAVSATSRSGEVQSDFEESSLRASNESDRGQISGKVGAGGPTITIVTSYGTIHLRKGS